MIFNGYPPNIGISVIIKDKQCLVVSLHVFTTLFPMDLHAISFAEVLVVFNMGQVFGGTEQNWLCLNCLLLKISTTDWCLTLASGNWMKLTHSIPWFHDHSDFSVFSDLDDGSDWSDWSGGKDSNCIAGCLGRRRACHGVGLGDIFDRVEVSTLRKTRGIPLKKSKKWWRSQLTQLTFVLFCKLCIRMCFGHGYHMVTMVESLIELHWIASDGDPNVSSMLLAFSTETQWWIMATK